ncbi:hypothetical protein N0V85_007517 [Neurospora sp. IMI 360204]|nr:hypothetical protein N0V85_007517 [Neurospora sp. IMI 360204]
MSEPLSEPLAGHPLEQSPSHSDVEPSQSQFRLIRQVKQMLGLKGSAGHAEAHEDPQLPELLPKLPNFLDLDLELPAEFGLPLHCTEVLITPSPSSAGAADPHLLHQDHQFPPLLPPISANTNKTTNLATATSASAAAISSTTQPTSATPSLFVSEGSFLLPADDDDDHPGPGPSSNYRDSFASAILDDPFVCQPVGAPNTHTTDTATNPRSIPTIIAMIRNNRGLRLAKSL